VEQTRLPAILSSIVVIVILVLLGVMLANRTEPAPTTASEQPIPTDPSGAEIATQIAQTQDGGESPIDPETGDTNAETDMEEADMANAPQLPTPVVPAQGEVIEGRPPFEIDPQGNYTAIIETPRGNVTVELFPTLAPQTVNNFVALSRQGFYDGLTWHRVLPDFMAQGGDPQGTGTGGPGWNVPGEFTTEKLFDKPGMVAMARAADPDSAGSQFFITTAPTPHLNYQYTIFGEVVEGQDIVNNIPLRDPMTATEPGEEIVSIQIVEE
jgi:peptidylprolyl isomerase